jgi:hypothetical protein
MGRINSNSSLGYFIYREFGITGKAGDVGILNFLEKIRNIFGNGLYG